MNGKEEKRAVLPLVTVVVISYNHGSFLEVCLESLFEQTYAKIQIIIVDNDSKDGSPAVIEQFVDRVQASASTVTAEAVLSPTNSHLTGAMVQGFAKANGSYVMFIDGDDYLLSAGVEAHIRAHLATRLPVGVTSIDMYQSRGADLVVGGLHGSRQVLAGKGHERAFCRMSNLDAFAFFQRPGGLDLQESELYFVDPSESAGWVWSATSGLCFRREAVQLMFSHIPRIGAGTDAYLARGISSITGSILIDRPLAVYRLHDTNMFTKHPSLTGLVQFDKHQLAVSNAEVSLELIECFRKQAADLAGRLELPDTYIQAIDMFSKVGDHHKALTPYSSYTAHFLITDRDRLIAAFGTSTYNRWLRRYLSIRDWIAVTKQRRSNRSPGP